jgi:hypothetical protein
LGDAGAGAALLGATDDGAAVLAAPPQAASARPARARPINRRRVMVSVRDRNASLSILADIFRAWVAVVN